MQTLQIAGKYYEPLTYPCSIENLNPTPKCPHPGSDAEILAYLLQLSNISYSLQAHDAAWGTFVDGMWTGLLGLLQNGTIDTISTRYRHVKIRTEYFDFSYPVITSPVAFLVRKGSAGVSESAGIVFHVFHPILWALLVAAVIAVGIGMITITVLGSQMREVQTIPDSLWTCFRLLINQYEPVSGRNMARNLLFVWGSFLALIFLPLYQNGLLAQLLIPRTSNQFQSAADLVAGVKTGRFTFAAPGSLTAFYQNVEQAENSFTRNLKEALKANPVLLVPSMTKIVNLVSLGTHIYVGAYSTVLVLAQKNCLLQTVTVPDIFVENMSFIFRKNDPRLQKINQATIESLPFIRHVTEKYRKSLQSQCSNQFADSVTLTRSLSITSLSGTLLLLLVGSGCAFSFLAVEICLCDSGSCIISMLKYFRNI